MTMFEIHQQALDDIPVAYHEFLLAYKKEGKYIYGFVEGKTDPSFYENRIQNELPEGWKVDLWPAGSKDAVLKVFQCFDWKRFSNKQVLFFVDRDFSPYLPMSIPKGENIYTTDHYSIENSLVSREVCGQILRDLKGMTDLNRTEMANVLDLFEGELARFHAQVLPISAHMIAWRRNEKRPCSEDVKMKDLFGFSEGKLTIEERPKGTTGLPAYLCKKQGLHRRGLLGRLAAVTHELGNEPEPKRYVRGKYELWFMLEFCKDVHANVKLFAPSMTSTAKTSCSLGPRNAMAILAPRGRTPASLKTFLQKTAFAHAEGK